MAINGTVCFLLIPVALFISGECSGNRQTRFVVEDEYATLMAKVNNLTREVEILKRIHDHRPVSFLAYLQKSIAGQHHQIIFDDVIFNLGNAYHVTHGNFIAPVNGLYQFVVTTCSNGYHSSVLELTVNTVVVGKVVAGDRDWRDCNTGSFLQNLSAGDDVYVQHETGGDFLLSLLELGRPLFSGVLLDV